MTATMTAPGKDTRSTKEESGSACATRTALKKLTPVVRRNQSLPTLQFHASSSSLGSPDISIRSFESGNSHSFTTESFDFE
eukprot:CAMPEP_0198114290 /NCGR_PEP_ID=MMETSP1442-20131203/5717_1 /TAXON_ID= /ORGANISM="Craspedostauros australis, Strain CCMP3328" /LENGTH=80 /DNA_ID=CAMNT_0043771569 /DNA_START=49 /DNA_END=291 /DNA_ORIENTATION=+